MNPFSTIFDKVVKNQLRHPVQQYINNIVPYHRINEV